MQNDSVKFKMEFKKRLYKLILSLILLIKEMPKDDVSAVISKQLLRSGTSVLANYVEASASSSKRDFINFFTYSLKSANESKLWLKLLLDTYKNMSAKIEPLLYEFIEISNVIASSLLTMKGKK